jgi:hypothetical protein
LRKFRNFKSFTLGDYIMKKNLIILAAFVALFASAPAFADADSGANGNGSDMTTATTQGGFGNGSDSNGGVR